MVSGSQRVPSAVAEPALEVGAPGLIGGIHGGERLGVRRRRYAWGGTVGQAGTLQHFAHGAFRRPDDLGMRGGEFHAQLAGSPFPAVARGDDMRNDLVTELARRVVRCAAATGESGDSASSCRASHL